jgi:hypothetical protein
MCIGDQARPTSRVLLKKVKMNNTRLIKRRELIEREQVAKKNARLSLAAQVKVETVMDWVKRHQASRRPNARVMFAALFAHRQTS